jgi:F-type H+-transporting ATPase subunit delta
MNIPEVVRRYAITLLDAAQETGAQSTMRRDLEGISAVLGASSELGDFLRNQLIGIELKQGALEKMFDGRVEALTMNFMRLLVQRRRGGMLQEITQACLQILDERSGVSTANVRSAVALDEAQADHLRRRLAGYFGGDIRLEVDVDDTMRGGLIATVGDTVFDGTVEAQLQRLHRRLLGTS